VFGRRGKSVFIGSMNEVMVWERRRKCIHKHDE